MSKEYSYPKISITKFQNENLVTASGDAANPASAEDKAAEALKKSGTTLTTVVAW